MNEFSCSSVLGCSCLMRASIFEISVTPIGVMWIPRHLIFCLTHSLSGIFIASPYLSNFCKMVWSSDAWSESVSLPGTKISSKNANRDLFLQMFRLMFHVRKTVKSLRIGMFRLLVYRSCSVRR